MTPATRLSLPLIALAACSQNVQIPPSRPLALEAPRTVAPGERRGRLQLGHHGSIFNNALDSGDLRLRSGLAPNLELQLDGTAIDVEDADRRHNMYLGRIGLKTDPAPGALAFHGGAGAGYSPAGGSMASADAGITIGAPWRLVSPFVSGATFLSAPIEPREVRTGDEPGDVDTPSVTAGAGFTLGLALVRERYSIAVGFDSTLVRDEDGSETFYSLAGAFEVALE